VVAPNEGELRHSDLTTALAGPSPNDEISLEIPPGGIENFLPTARIEPVVISSDKQARRALRGCGAAPQVRRLFDDHRAPMWSEFDAEFAGPRSARAVGLAEPGRAPPHNNV